ncbi:hypothetical protein CC80DRAFT_12254 [Byssothecium circinans]|uniref:Uncharacterized protein n=1 Tax=Byssothecium circinans TaxID=147558 RepID=A0A6A5UID4_9PLEO|nr:hypothetical protein CC80DRAFT_12254 [Byssothecium circinans]
MNESTTLQADITFLSIDFTSLLKYPTSHAYGGSKICRGPATITPVTRFSPISTTKFMPQHCLSLNPSTQSPPKVFSPPQPPFALRKSMTPYRTHPHKVPQDAAVL